MAASTLAQQVTAIEPCAEVTIEAARRRRREAVLRPGRLALWLQLLTPGLVDRLTVQRFLRPATNASLVAECLTLNTAQIQAKS
jgi:hypothetical protein